MENPMTNPTPYIAGAYSLALLLLVGYGLWTQRLRRKLKATVAVIREEE